MNKVLWIGMLVLILNACGLNTRPTLQSSATPFHNQSLATPQSLFRDEFNDSSLNLNKWVTAYTWGRENPPELQYYSPDAFEIKNGVLQIMARENVMESKSYSSGIITTYQSFKFTYGYVEARVRVPSGRGLWPALWLLDYGGESHEIDLMEILGDHPNVAYMTLHFPGINAKSDSTQGSYTGTDFSRGFHIFALRWNSKEIIWYIDNVERYRLTQHIPSNPMYLIANLAVGGDWSGPPDPHTQFPAYYDIDYIRVYPP